MAKEFSLILIHRQFQPAVNKRLVEYNDVAAPWGIDAPSVLPLHLRHLSQILGLYRPQAMPIEFGFEADAAAPVPSCQIPEAFIGDLETVLLRYGLTRVFCLGWVQSEANTTVVGNQLVESTTG